MLDIIKEFVEATAPPIYPAPDVFRHWSALGMVSALMSRRVWMTEGSGLLLYPNTFIVCVGEPASGKSIALDLAKKLLVSVPQTGRHVAFSTDKLTPADMILQIAEKFKGATSLTEDQEDGTELDDDSGQWSWNAFISEMYNFMPQPDLNFMQDVARLWDCPPEWGKGTRHDAESAKGRSKIVNPYITILGAAQPTWVQAILNRDTVGGGLPSRLLFIESKEVIEFIPFQPEPDPKRLRAICANFVPIMDMAGEMRFSQPARDYFSDWAKMHYPDKDGKDYNADEPQMAHYKRRRHMHVGKLAMIYAAARHPRLMRLELADMESAMQDLWHLDAAMPEIVAMTGGNPYKMAEKQVVDHFKAEYARRHVAISEAEVRRWVNQLMPTNYEEQILEGMVARQILIPIDPAQPRPRRWFRPGGDFPHA